MPEEIAPAFGHEALEADMERLAAEIRMRAGTPEAKEMNGEALLRESLKAFTPSPQGPPPAPATTGGALPDYAANASSETKLEVEYLVDMALHKGIAKATAEAAKSNPFVLDAFHDALAGKLYPEFKRRGILK